MSNETHDVSDAQREVHAIGERSAPVTLVVYGDYECPFTKALHFEIRRLLPRVRNLLRFVYRHFPMREEHPHAQLAAEAAEAAGAQGRFWEMHELLFRRQRALEASKLLEYAAMLTLDIQAFATALRRHTYTARVERDLLGGLAHGVRGTPTLFVDGNRYHGERTAEALERAVQETVRTWEVLG